MGPQKYFVYFLTNFLRTVLYIGVTNNLQQRIEQHRTSTMPGFTSTYHLTRLVYVEEFDNALSAIGREKQLKGWRRTKKEALISQVNPAWNDLGGRLDAIDR